MNQKLNQLKNICEYEGLQSLRAEIIESEKARIDLLKYKLIALAALGAIGLGFSGHQGASILPQSDYVLCIIPFVCIYVDLLCMHNTIRILVVGSFLKYYNDPYENFIAELGENTSHPKKSGYFFVLEDLAIYWSSVILSGLLALHGIFCAFQKFIPLYELPYEMKGYTFIVVGVIGMILPIFIKYSYQKRITKLFNATEKIKTAPEMEGQ